MSVDITTIGIGFDTAGLMRGESALRDVESQANSTANATDQAAGRLGKLDDAANRTATEIAALNTTMGSNNRSMEAQGATLSGLVARLAGLESALSRTGSQQRSQEDQTKRTTKGQEQQAKAASDLINKLQGQAATYGMSARAQDMFTLSSNNATKAQIAQAQAVYNAMEKMDRARELGESIGNGMRTGLVLGLGAAAAAAGAAYVAFEKLIGGVANYQDMAEKTGADPVGLSALRTAADVGGSSVEALSAISIRLQKNLSKVTDESKGAGEALKAIGLTVADIKDKGADEQFRILGKALNGYADSGAKAAVIQDILGRGAAQHLPALKELGKEEQARSRLTAEQIAMADDYKDAQARSTSEMLQAAEAIAIKFLPAVVAITEAVRDTLKPFADLTGASGKLGKDTGIQMFSIAAVESFASIIDAGSKVINFIARMGAQISGISKAIGRGLRGDSEGKDAALAEMNSTIAGLQKGDAFMTSLTENMRKRAAAARQEVNNPTVKVAEANANTLRYTPGADNADKAEAKAQKQAAKTAYDADLASFAMYADEKKFRILELSKATEAANKRGNLSDFDALQRKTDLQLEDIENSRVHEKQKLDAAKRSGLQAGERVKAEERYSKAMQDLRQAEIAALSGQERAEAALNDKSADEAEKRLDAIVSRVQKLKQEGQSLEEEREEFGLTTEAVMALKLARVEEMAVAKERDAMRATSEDERAWLLEEADLIRRNGKVRVENSGVQKMAEQGKQFAEDLERGLTDSLFRAFEAGRGFFSTLWSGIKNLFKTTVLKLAVEGVTGGASGMVSGLASTMSGSSGGIGSVLGSLGSLASGSGILGAAGLGMQAGFGALMSSGLTGISAAVTGGIASIGTATASGVAAGLGTIAGALGPIALGIGVAYSLLSGKKDSRYGSQYNYSAGAGTRVVGGPNAGVDYGGMSAANQGTVAAIETILRRLGSSTTVAGFNSGFESSVKGKGFSYAGGVLSNGASFGQQNANNNRGSKSTEEAMAEYQTELKQATLQALQSAIDIPKSLSSMLAGVNIDSLGVAAIDQIIAAMDKQIGEVEAFRTAMESMPFERLRNASFDTAAGLLAASGGLDNLASGIGAFTENYLTAEEKRAAKIANINKVLAGTGIDANTLSKDVLKQRILSQEVVTASGQAMFAKLIGVAGAFASVADEATGTASATDNLTRAKDELIDAYGREADAMQATIERFKAFASDIRSFRDGLLIGNLSPLTPEQKYGETSRQFDAVLAATRTGSEDDRAKAFSKLESSASAFLEASRLRNSSSGAYATDFNRVQAALSDSANNAMATVDVARLQLDINKQQLSALGEINTSVLSLADALTNYDIAKAQANVPQPMTSPGLRFGTSTNDLLLAEVRRVGDNVENQTTISNQQTADLIRAQFLAMQQNAEIITESQSIQDWSQVNNPYDYR